MDNEHQEGEGGTKDLNTGLLSDYYVYVDTWYTMVLVSTKKIHIYYV